MPASLVLNYGPHFHKHILQITDPRRMPVPKKITDDKKRISTVQFSSVSQSCPTLRPHQSQHARPPCPSPTLGVHQTRVHQVSDAIQPSHSGSSPSPPAPNPSQHHSLFQWVNSSHEVAEALEFQLQHHSLQRNPRADLLQNRAMQNYVAEKNFAMGQIEAVTSKVAWTVWKWSSFI